MEWLFILGLAGVAWWQAQRIGALTRKLDALERLLGVRPEATPRPAEAAFAPPQPAPAPPVDDREPLLLDQPLPPEKEEPLLLDTPLPEASNDDGGAPSPAAAPLAPPLEHAPAAFTPRAKAPPNRRLEKWLAENGFAWLGGSLVVLGVAFLVNFAAQQGWFTPPLRLAAALLLGAALIGASEAARRAGLRKPPGHPLVAAMLAGAGVVAFYATTWAAHGVYNFIPWQTAALLLVLCATILVGLSFLHGQALGVLAIAAALLAPPLASMNVWPSAALTFYVVAVASAGFCVALLRRWSWVAIAAIAGLYFWYAAAIAADEWRRALALLAVASTGGVLVALRTPAAAEEKGVLAWPSAKRHLPNIAVCASSVFLLGIWIALASAPAGHIAGPACIGAFHIALAAAFVRLRILSPATLTIAIASLVIGLMAYLRWRFFYGPLGPMFYPTVLFASFAVAACALVARPHHSARRQVAAAGAIGSALLVAIAAFSRADWHGLTAWAALFSGAAILFAAAWRAAQSALNREADWAVDFWAGAGAALMLLGVESAFPDSVRTTAHAGAALLFAFGLAWRGWRALRFAAITAAVLTLAHALSPALIGAALAGSIPLGGALTVLAAAAALLYGAGYFAGRGDAQSQAREALSSAAVIVILIGAFTALRWFAAGGAGAPLDVLAETALQALTLLAAAHVVMPRATQAPGRIGALRGHVLMGAGLLYAFFIAGIALNPWWGASPASVAGPPLFNTLALAFAAPAAFAFAAAYRLYDRQRAAARAYAGAGASLALIWALSEIRYAFHAGETAGAPVGVFEGACYALAFLGGALGVAIAARMRAAKNPDRPFTQDLMRVMRGGAWFGIVVSGIILLLSRHPWWGVHFAGATEALESGLAVVAQAAAAAMALFLGRALSVARGPDATRFAAAALATMLAWSFGHAAIRWLHHGGAIDDAVAFAGLEGFAHALWPLVLVLAASEITARAPGRDTVRSYLYDLQAIWAVAIWPALAFAGLGLWLFFNPWRGAAPAEIGSPLSAAAALSVFLLAAWLSAIARRTPHVRFAGLFARVSTVACVAHLFAAATLVVRWLFHRNDMNAAPATEVEMWTYSAVWALFGAGVFWLGMRRRDPVLRWSALAILLATTAKVFLFDMARLSGVVRVASFIGLGLVLLAIAWAARRFGTPPPPGPGDLLTITPSARRERRYGRRQRSS